MVNTFYRAGSWRDRCRDTSFEVTTLLTWCDVDVRRGSALTLTTIGKLSAQIPTPNCNQHGPSPIQNGSKLVQTSPKRGHFGQSERLVASHGLYRRGGRTLKPLFQTCQLTAHRGVTLPSSSGGFPMRLRHPRFLLQQAWLRVVARRL